MNLNIKFAILAIFTVLILLMYEKVSSFQLLVFFPITLFIVLNFYCSGFPVSLVKFFPTILFICLVLVVIVSGNVSTISF